MTVSVALGCSLLTLTAPTVEAQGPTPVRTDGCTAVVANPEVPLRNIDPLVPDEFTIDATRPPSPDDPLEPRVALGIEAVHCERVWVGNSRPRPSTWSTFRVPLLVPPEGEPPQELLPPPHFDVYQLWYVSDNLDLVRLLRREGGESQDEIVHVPNLRFDLSFGPGETTKEFTFTAPPPRAPSPFTIEATVSRPTGATLPQLSLHHYSTNPRGWMVIGQPDTLQTLQFGSAHGNVIVEPNTQLGQVFCDDNPNGEFRDDQAGTATYARADFSVIVRPRETEREPRAQCP
ncbi:hypothetical protein [Streptomyces sp. NPDC002851]